MRNPGGYGERGVTPARPRPTTDGRRGPVTTTATGGRVGIPNPGRPRRGHPDVPGRTPGGARTVPRATRHTPGPTATTAGDTGAMSARPRLARDRAPSRQDGPTSPT